jgi:DNA polymerase
MTACEDGRARGHVPVLWGQPDRAVCRPAHPAAESSPESSAGSFGSPGAGAPGKLRSLELLYDSIPDVLSQLIRTAFVPRQGMKFVVSDFSAIEARVLSWLAGEKWKSAAFAAGKDIYCSTASQMFGVPVVKHGVNGDLRQKGKIAELA